MGEGFIKSKALDDRVGCAILIEMINSDTEYDLYFSFSTREEVGSGASAAAFNIKPDYALVLETTTAADIYPAKGDERVCVCGKGPVISFMDRGTVYDRDMYKMIFDIAKTNNIPCQPKTRVAGGNNARQIHVSAGGVRTAAISVPCRYIHSASDMLKFSDVIETSKLVKAVVNKLAND
ncbi:MAG: hypothetical protein K6B52_05385 [Clostridiales bacterium]|nr:hypothetical protein [Clostridiales bacterium]